MECVGIVNTWATRVTTRVAGVAALKTKVKQYSYLEYLV